MKGLHLQANLCSDLLYLGIKQSVFVYLFVSVGYCTLAQTSKELLQTSSLSNIKYDVQPLTIGDRVPDITFHNVLNYKNKTTKLSDFKGKLVILDMWSVFCTSCIAGFPKMEKLQKEFGDKIQILLVNPHDAKFDSEEKIKTTLRQYKIRTGYYPSLPVPIHDSVLNKYFPHESVPHQVWIDGERNLIAITGSNDVSAENIRKFLSGENPRIAIKNDRGFDKSKPLLFSGNGGDEDDFIYRSIFIKFKGGIGFSSGIRLNAQDHVIGLFMLNKPLRQFIEEAYDSLLNGVPNNRVFFETDNQQKFNYDFDEANAYCYDLIIPATKRKHLDSRRYLQEDLKRYFNISVRREKRKMNCLIITENNKLNYSLTKYKNSQFDLDTSSIYNFIHNYKVSDIIKMLDRFEKPMINETGTTKSIDIEFPINFNLSDFKSVIQVLKDAGLNIREEQKWVDVIVISDKLE